MDNLENEIESNEEETVEELETEDSIEPQDEAVDSEEVELEPWQIEDDQEPEEVMPVSSHVRARKKLKGKIDDLSKENETLKAQIDALKNPKPSTANIKRPNELDYDSDEEFQAALTEYEDSRFQQYQKVQKAEADKAERIKKIEEGVNSHYARAEELVTKYNLNPEEYKGADMRVRSAVESVMPGVGDKATDGLISLMGEGSEKVIYSLGRNKNLLAQFQSKLIEDRTGIQAALFLGQQMEKLTKPKKQNSRAPSPAPHANGNEVPSAKAATLKRKYQAAHKKKDGAQDAYNIKKEARAAGIDVSSW